MHDLPKVTAYWGVPNAASTPITGVRTKAGGAPVFCEPTTWPKCGACRQDMDFVAQICLKAPVRISTPYDFAYVFMCFHYEPGTGALTCPSYEAYSGANAVLLQQYGGTTFEAPRPAGRVYPEFSIAFEPFVDIDVEDADASEDVFEEMADRRDAMKVGGPMRWLQTDETPNCAVCGTRLTAIAQIGGECRQACGADGSQRDRVFHFDFDRAYSFLCTSCGDPRSAAVLWQCD